MARLPRAILHRDEALQLAIEQNPGARGYLLTQMWTEVTGVHLILAGDYPRYLAIEEDPPVASGGRHEYDLRTLRCDRHVLNDGRQVHVRGGCGRIGAVMLERQDKAAERLRRLQVMIMGLQLAEVYLEPHEPEDEPAWDGWGMLDWPG